MTAENDEVEQKRRARSEVETLLEHPVADPTDSIRATVSASLHAEAPSVTSLSGGRLELGELLGKGGMGVVHVGHQPHLGRTVAVKTAKTPGRDDGVRALLSEAFVTGQLEHPNIVPIHDIVLDGESEPQVVLKRIEGSGWRELLEDPDEVRGRFDVDDTLGWHLRVLLSVCQALRFAHSRGIVHRDVKPSNVMIGRFGEIYLLDWGLAWRVPAAEDLEALADRSLGFGGSPAYMAPEQFDPDVSGIGPHTDVYLVGATLFEILTGSPPRTGKDLKGHLAAALDGPSDPGPDAPPELAAIAKKAMAARHEDRFASVQDVRIAIQAFLEHRASRLMATKAARSVDDMNTALAADDDTAAERAFVEATFGYRAALEAWDDNEDARDALSVLIRSRIEDALEAGALESAARMLALGPELDEGLRDRVRAAVDEHARRERELAALEADRDATRGVGTRRLLTLIIFGGWVGWWTYAGLGYPMSAGDMVIGPAAIGALTIALALATRRQLSSKHNQNLVSGVIAMMGATVSWLLAAAQVGIDDAFVPLPLLLIWAVATTIGALAIDWRALPAGILYFVAFHIAAADPVQVRWLLGGTSLCWLINALVVNVLVTRGAKLDRGDGSR